MTKKATKTKDKQVNWLFLLLFLISETIVWGKVPNQVMNCSPLVAPFFFTFFKSNILNVWYIWLLKENKMRLFCEETDPAQTKESLKEFKKNV